MLKTILWSWRGCSASKYVMCFAEVTHNFLQPQETTCLSMACESTSTHTVHMNS